MLHFQVYSTLNSIISCFTVRLQDLPTDPLSGTYADYKYSSKQHVNFPVVTSNLEITDRMTLVLFPIKLFISKHFYFIINNLLKLLIMEIRIGTENNVFYFWFIIDLIVV